MATVAELVVERELSALRENAELHGWDLKVRDPTSFILNLPVKDGSSCALLVRCDGYKAMPPAWHWYNPETGAIDAPGDTLLGGGFLHSAGVICAPWNRLAYAAVDPRGPHPEWQLGNWMERPETGATRTLAAMAERIAHELQTSFDHRKA